MKPEKIRVLIAEDKDEHSNAIRRIVEKMLNSLGLNITLDFCQSTTHKTAKSRVKKETFDLIILGGELDNKKSTLSLIPDIKQNNIKAIVCFFSPNPMFVEKAKKKTDIEMMCFYKDISAPNGYSGIIRSEDLEEIRKTFMLKHKNLLGILT